MIRRVLLSTINYDHPQRGMMRAFAALFPEVREYDFLDLQRKGKSLGEISQGLVDCAMQFSPDWIWLQLQETDIIRPEALQEIREKLPRCVISHWTGDCRRTVSPYMAFICRTTHLTLLSNVGQIGLFKTAGAPVARYCQIGVDWEEDVLGLPEWTPPFQVPEVVFCGHYYGDVFPGTAERVEAIDALWKAGVRLGIVGRGWPVRFPVVGHCGVKKQVHVWSRAKVALNINNFNDVEGYYSDRQLISMASGTPVVCRYVPGLEREFENGIECVWYQRVSELVTHVVDLLKSEPDRRRIGRQGRAAILRRHTWWHRILDVMPVVEEIRSTL